MSTTTIRLPDDLKARIDKLAASAGKSSHAFMIDSLIQAAELTERQLAFDAEVNKRWARLQRTREVLTLDDVRTYAQALAKGQRPARPRPRKLAEPERKTRTS